MVQGSNMVHFKHTYIASRPFQRRHRPQAPYITLRYYITPAVACSDGRAGGRDVRAHTHTHTHTYIHISSYREIYLVVIHTHVHTGRSRHG